MAYMDPMGNHSVSWFSIHVIHIFTNEPRSWIVTPNNSSIEVIKTAPHQTPWKPGYCLPLLGLFNSWDGGRFLTIEHHKIKEDGMGFCDDWDG